MGEIKRRCQWKCFPAGPTEGHKGKCVHLLHPGVTESFPAALLPRRLLNEHIMWQRPDTTRSERSPLHHWNGCINAPEGVLADGIRGVFTNTPPEPEPTDDAHSR